MLFSNHNVYPLLSVPSLWRRIPSYCWWFRNPKQPPFGCIKPVINGRFQLPTSTGELILNHPTAWKLTYPLENEGWKMKFPFKMVPFQKKSFIFGGVSPPMIPRNPGNSVKRHGPRCIATTQFLFQGQMAWPQRDDDSYGEKGKPNGFSISPDYKALLSREEGYVRGEVGWLVGWFFSQKSHPENTLEEAEDYWLLDLFRRSAIAFSGRCQ